MNDQILTEMRVIVERAVRPVRASDARKLRMRQELLDHLRAIYDEELERLGDDAAALARARERFGDPHGLTDELQRSLSCWGPVGFVFDLYRYRQGVSLLRFALTHLLLSFLTMAAVSSLVVLLALLDRRIHEIGYFAHVMLVMALFSAGFSFSFTILAEQMGQTLYGRDSLHRRGTMIRYGLASLLVFPLLTALVHDGFTLSFASALRGLLLGCIAAPTAPVFFYFLGRQMKKQIAQEAEWLGIEIDG